MEQTVVYKPHMTKKKAVLDTIKWLFLGVMIIFTLYPIIYTILGSLKTNAGFCRSRFSDLHQKQYFCQFLSYDSCSCDLFTGRIYSGKAGICRKENPDGYVYVYDVCFSWFDYFVSNL